MRIALNPDGTINAIGSVLTYPYEAPVFIVASGHSRWQCNNIALINDQLSWTEFPPILMDILEVIDREKSFCLNFTKLLFKKLREDVSLTNAQRLTLLGTIEKGMNALQWGDVPAARASFNSIATTSLWTQVRKDWVLAQLDAFIA